MKPASGVNGTASDTCLTAPADVYCIVHNTVLLTLAFVAFDLRGENE